jgi:hypothetical protein
MGHIRSPYSSAWLWRLAFYIAVVGGGLTYYLYNNITDPAMWRPYKYSLFLTMIGVGLCVICATRNWWMRH